MGTEQSGKTISNTLLQNLPKYGTDKNKDPHCAGSSVLSVPYFSSKTLSLPLVCISYLL